jgi:hypothetical protein
VASAALSLSSTTDLKTFESALKSVVGGGGSAAKLFAGGEYPVPVSDAMLLAGGHPSTHPLSSA